MILVCFQKSVLGTCLMISRRSTDYFSQCSLSFNMYINPPPPPAAPRSCEQADSDSDSLGQDLRSSIPRRHKGDTDAGPQIIWRGAKFLVHLPSLNTIMGLNELVIGERFSLEKASLIH